MGLFTRDDRAPTENKPLTEKSEARQHMDKQAADNTVTVIAQSNHLEGSILGSGDVRIEGKVKGKVNTTGRLLVAAGGIVEAEVSASSVTVAGDVLGDISAKDKIELAPTAKVEGNISAPKILINEGATFDGQVAMKASGAPDAPVVPQPSVTTSSARRDQEKKAEE